MDCDRLQIGDAVDWSPVTRPRGAEHHGRHVRLEPIAVRHVEALFTATHPPHAEPELWTYLPYGPFGSASDLAQWVAGAPDDDPLFFALCGPVDGVARGVASLMRIDPHHGVIEIGHVWLAPVIQRSRGATEAIFMLMREAFDGLGYRRVEWKCDALNRASRRAAERYGFTFEGIFRQAAVIKGHNRDTAWYSILDTEWSVIGTALRQWLDDRNFDERGGQRRRLTDIRHELVARRAS